MKISLVVPVFNEEEAIPRFFSEVSNYEGLKTFHIECVFVNDGSADKTEEIINNLSYAYPESGRVAVKALSFSRNFGKEAALFAGIENATGDVVIPIDVDLQDPINVIPKLIEKYLNTPDVDIVLAKRIDRSSDSFLKRKTAELFYKVHNQISETKLEENVGDFRLLSKTAVEAIKQLPEKKLFMKGILSWVGFKTEIVEYTREKRIAGQTKFNGWKLWNLALEGITSFSTVPLRLWTYLGLFIAAISFVFGLFLIVDKVFFGNDVPGYPSIMCAVLFLGGIQLIGIGVLGEYVGRIYIESKNRPKYILKNK